MPELKKIECTVAGTIVKWYKAGGEKLNADDVLCEVQTDNGIKNVSYDAMDLDEDHDAILNDIFLHQGEVGPGDLIGMIKIMKVPSESETIYDIKMPHSEGMTEGIIVKWYKAEGEKLSTGDVICVVNKDWANPKFETIKANVDGVLDIILVKDGDKCVPGGLIGLLKNPTKSVQEVTESHASKSTVIEIKNLYGKSFKKKDFVQLLKRTGNFDEQNGIWINFFNSHALVKFNSEAEAKETLCALNGVYWPSSNQKKLKVTFSNDKYFQKMKMKEASDKSKDSNIGKSGKGGKGLNAKSGPSSKIEHWKQLRAKGKSLTGRQKKAVEKAEKAEEKNDVFFIAPMSKIEQCKKKFMKS